jgi:putative FmdB family regulatory protein
MPIYEYRCSACGHQDEFLQKVSEPVLSQCPACGKPTFEKQLSAAGFHLKGSGWYATDFKNKKPPEKKTEAKNEAKTEAKTESKTETKSEPKPKAAATTD